MHILVTSPIPSHPQNHGNRARVFKVCKALQARGYIIHFVYGGLEGLTSVQETAMRRTWDHVYTLPGLAPGKIRSLKTHHLIDDWYREDITALTQRIIKVWDIRICLANYVWFSRWLEDVPEGIPKILDTHDIFTDRDARLEGDAIKAAWFSTTESEEAKALKRADVVLAIQDFEAKHFERITSSPVRILGHLTSPQFVNRKTHAKNSKLNIGLLASDNPINQHSLSLLSHEITANPDLAARCTFHLAGALSTTGAANQPFFTKHGFVDDAAAFHADMDIVINPNIGGTGLKIKSVDALSYGVPFVATSDAMVGIETTEPQHLHTDVAALCNGLLSLAANPENLSALAATSHDVFTRYHTVQMQTLDDLFPIIDVPDGRDQT